MRFERGLAAVLAWAATGAGAVTVSVSPAQPTPVDTVVLEVMSDQPCALLIPGTVEMASQVIRVRYDTGAGVFCVNPAPQPQRMALGRLPAGSYTVELIPTLLAQFPVAPAMPFTVTNPPPSADMGPLDDYSGHYVGDGPNEGVFVTQFGRTAFISYLYYGPEGKPTWAVMPDAKWQVGENGSAAFVGGVMHVEVIPTGVGTGTGALTSFQYLGVGRFSPSLAFDHARLEVTLPQPVSRNLTRFRF